MNIKMYGADWCSDCISAKNFFDSKDNDEAIKFLESVNNGKRIIPTLDIDGEIYSNPGISKLIKIIGE